MRKMVAALVVAMQTVFPFVCLTNVLPSELGGMSLEDVEAMKKLAERSDDILMVLDDLRSIS